MIMLSPSETDVLTIRFVIPVVFLNKPDSCVCTYLKEFYDATIQFIT